MRTIRRLSSKIISIHAAREGGDETLANRVIGDIGISIHAAREGGDCGNE